ncbi:MAG: flagellin [Desulfurivibrionaceae bacterium]|jgi:flagellin
MAFQITNTTSLYAHGNLVNSYNSLAKSVERLSSGLRINHAADDPAGLHIASGLDAQAKSFGQAIRNSNDGVSIMQIMDDALAESASILSSIKTKAVQAAQDSQTTASRQTIQNDITKLLEELDIIAQTSTYNGQNLLTGIFSDKKFQVGAYANEILSVSVDSAESIKVGHVRTAELTLTNSTGGAVELSFYSNLTNETLSIKSVSVQYDNTAENSMGALADAINAYKDTTGISAYAVVETTSTDPVQGGSTGSDFAINDIAIGAVTTLANDTDNSLINAINNKTSSHGITASITAAGQLKLTSSDGRAIKVSGAQTALTASDANTISTFGSIQLYQTGSYSINMNNLSEGLAVSFASGGLSFTMPLPTSINSTLATGSLLASTSTLKAGFTAGKTLLGTDLNGNIANTTLNSTILTGSVLATGSIVKKNTVLGGSAVNNGDITTTANSLLKSGSTLKIGSTLKAGTYMTNTIGALTIGTTLSVDSVTTVEATLSNDMLLLNGSIIKSASTMTAGSYVGENITLNAAMTTSQNMTLLSGSTIADVDGVTSIAAGSTVGGDTLLGANVTTTQSMTLKSGSSLANGSILANGSTIGGDATVNGAHTLTADLSLAANSVLANASVIKAGTVLTNDIVTTVGLISASATPTTVDYTTSGSNTLNLAMTLKSASVIASGSVLAANAGGAASTQLTSEATLRLSDLSVLTASDAQTAIVLAEAAMDDINTIRANVGATQSQFIANASNLTTAQLNAQNAYSNIMDIDFSEETTIFTKMNVLVQSGAFALTQANAMTTSVLDLLQGGSQQ